MNVLLYADVAVSRVDQRGGATCDLMTSRDPAHVTLTSYGEVEKSTACNVELGVDETSSVQQQHQQQQQQQPTAADYSLNQQTSSTCVSD